MRGTAHECTLVEPLFDPANYIVMPHTSAVLQRNYSEHSRAATSGDWNGDGLMDLYVANSGSENEVLLGDGQGGFASTLLPATTHMVNTGAASGDWNGDGLTDVFVTAAGFANEVLISDGQGGFNSKLLQRTDLSSGATAGDWNGDGLDDIFVVNVPSRDGLSYVVVPGSGANEVLLGDGQGGFTSTLLPRTDISYGATAGDWNGAG